MTIIYYSVVKFYIPAFNSCYSDDGSQDISTFIMITGGVIGASIVIIVLTVGAVLIVLHHKPKIEAQGMPCMMYVVIAWL